MGPTNIALVKLFRAEQELRAAHERLESVSRGVRVQERKVKDLTERLQAAQTRLREQQAQANELDLDLKARDAHIEKLRLQQQQSQNAKEYQTFLVEISTEKVDRAKVEDQLLNAMQAVEQAQKDVQELSAQLGVETASLASVNQEVGGRIHAVQAEIDALKPKRDAAATGVTPKALTDFERLVDRFDGEAMSAIAKPDRRREEYVCTACNMSLVADIYNRLHVRDEPVFCPSCRRMLYIPDDLPPEEAIRQPRKESRPRAGKKPRSSESDVGAAVTRQTSAADVLASMRPDPQEAPPAEAEAPHD
jgi:predicted  nucleic acid-binding Zn-ribbon protein